MTADKRFNLAFYDEYDGTFSIQDMLYWEENKHLHSLDEIIDLLNELDSENKKLEKENLDLSEELDYYKTKCASLETGYIQEQDENWRLEKSKMDFANELAKTIDENELLKQRLKRCRDWINSDKNDYELTLAFIKNKGYSLKDVLEYEKELQE